jgi:hypothetical protein
MTRSGRRVTSSSSSRPLTAIESGSSGADPWSWPTGRRLPFGGRSTRISGRLKTPAAALPHSARAGNPGPRDVTRCRSTDCAAMTDIPRPDMRGLTAGFRSRVPFSWRRADRGGPEHDQSARP